MGNKCGKQSVDQAAADVKAAVDGLPTNAKIVFVLGGPGSGKGTQCAKIVEKYGYQHLSAGDLLRDEVKSGSEIGKQCEQIMKEGKLVPQEVIIGLLKAAMIKSGASDFLIDGFPRALDQAHMFESMVKPCEYVIFFDCPEEVMESRLLKRGETSGRSDDNAETIRKRFKTFVEQSLPVIEHYEKQGKAYKISATQTPDEVFAEVQKVLDGNKKADAPAAEAAAPAAETAVEAAPAAAPAAEAAVEAAPAAAPAAEAAVEAAPAAEAAAEAAVEAAPAAEKLPEDLDIVFVLGGPGSGKGTQCAKIVEKYGHCHLSAGDLLRDEVKSGSELGKQCEQIMKEGKLVPMEVIIGLLRTAMIKSGAKSILIDGFPRALDQAEMFENNIKPCQKVIFFDCPEEVMESRLLKRGETSGRSDDNAETIRKRFKTFVEQSLPVIEHYEKQGKAYKISATQTPDEVFVEVVKALEA